MLVKASQKVVQLLRYIDMSEFAKSPLYYLGNLSDAWRARIERLLAKT